MKAVKVTLSALSNYKGKTQTPLKCHKCGRKLEAGETVQRTKRGRRYYCSTCILKMELDV